MTHARPNPAPPEWQELPPDTPYACAGEHVGDTVPGRAGGRVVGCATPSKARPHEGQYRLGSLGPGGRNVRKSRVRKSLHRTAGGKRKRAVCPDRRDALLSAADLAQALAEPSPVPYAVELEFPHTPGESLSCARHPKWKAFGEVLDAVRDRYREDTGDEIDADTLAADARAYDPALWRWAVAAHRKGLAQWEERVASRKLVTGRDSDERTRGRRRSEAVRRGIDTTGKNYRDDVLRGREDVYMVANPRRSKALAKANPSGRELARRTAAGARAAARVTGRAVVAGARWAAPRAKKAAIATGRAAVRAGRWVAPRAKAAALATGRASVRAAKATGRAVRRGAKRAAPHVARGLQGAAARLERWAKSNPAPRFYWVSGGYRCAHKHPSPDAAVNCGLAHVASGEIRVYRW